MLEGDFTANTQCLARVNFHDQFEGSFGDRLSSTKVVRKM